ncbi:DUF5998 family protein [Propioniciclava tarda]|uniref:Phosphodiesterase n=1 Tax=Propioniciclava tarda TaxID=433330 RepID=A0A4Q9KN75_PROTD|nr:DUF5998 family protein [Propioniciclava tarda]TBT96012.1 phosphodiesterase [Propioniciclava tarda]SMO43023.1 hypothetical protein SAMN06266982_102295 [Propioniciclava tarda]HOA88569.1 DUF5998 family protein [Propioniciclava tarda]HQA30831.1 DUF5998 family protein [Propioniciclava tarda]HQD60582.1 DUF5998 family protein [Propioniciclava tarda]
MTSGLLPKPLRDAIVACGYFPEVIESTVARALGSETIEASCVHHEATFDSDELHRHVTVLVLTPTRFLVSHTDDGESPGVGQALATVESVPLRSVRSVSVTSVVSNPARYRRGATPDEVWLAVGWGAMRRVEIVPASCGDPNCEADHGYDAQNLDDDLTIRMSVAADGDDSVARLIAFATALQVATS